MQHIKNESFGGERPLFRRRDLSLENTAILAGESALKECSNVSALNCRFEGKYPFWHNEKFELKNCVFAEGARAAIWYSKDMKMSDCLIEAPKMFRDMSGIFIENSRFPNAQETLWHCGGIEVRNSKFERADYLFLQSVDIRLENSEINGNYAFQYCANVELRNCVINSKDAFWNTENVTIFDSKLSGEYLAWHSKNLTLVNCEISGTQSLCYAKNLVIKNCRLAKDADLCFEYSTLNAEIEGAVTSVKNPDGGSIRADFIGELILDEHCKNPKACKIEANIGKSSVYEI